MPEQPRTVFISCGQSSDEERALGQQVEKLLGELTPFEGYFAQSQVSLKTLTENVLTRLHQSVGLIAIMHHRGLVVHNRGFDEIPSEEKIIRGSLWIEQEVAIAAFMEQVLHRPLHVALFVQRGIAIDGIRKHLHLNAVEFETGAEVIEHLRKILPDWQEPRYIGEDERRKQAESVELSIKVLQGWNFSLTIQVGNLSQIPVEIKSIVLRSGNAKLSDPIYRPENANWTLGGGAGFPINFRASHDVAQRLIDIHGKQRTNLAAPFGPANRFTSKLTVELRCEILGIERPISEECFVQINLATAEINGL